MSYLDTIKSQLDEKLDAADEYLGREGFDPADPGYVALTAELDTLKRSYERAVEVNNTRAAANSLAGTIAHSAARQQQRSTEQPQAQDSLGTLFTRSDEFAGYPGRGTSSRVTLERSLPMGIGTVGDGIPGPAQVLLPKVEGPAPLLGLIPTVQVSTNSVEIVTWEQTGTAGIVPEGQMKPPVEWSPTITPVTLDTIAAYTQLTRQLIEDAPAVRSLIDGELRMSVTRKLESEAAVALAAATLPTVDQDTLLKAIRVGIGTVQAEGFQPNVVLLNPLDWAELDISVLGSTLLGPSMGSQFWALRPVASIAQPVGTATVGDFSAGSVRYTRTGVSLYLTDSHGDTFLRNVFTLLAEARAKTVVLRPAAFAECTVTP